MAELTEKDIQERREEMNKFYDDIIPFLEKQAKYMEIKASISKNAFEEELYKLQLAGLKSKENGNPEDRKEAKN